MPEIARQVVITNKDKLPEALRDFVRIEETESGGAYGFDEEGNRKQIRKTGNTIVEFALMAGGAEEINGSDMDPAMSMILNELRQTNQLLENMQTDLETLRAKLNRYEEGMDGYQIGDAVGWQQEEDEDSYEVGYIVIGYTDEKIRIRDLETGELHEVEPIKITHETELEEDEEEKEEAEYEQNDEVALRQADGKYKPGFEVADPTPDENGLIEVKDLATGQMRRINPDLLKRTAELNPDETAPPAIERRRYIPRVTRFGRLRSAMPWAGESREWYINDTGPYYLDNNGREVYVPQDEVDGRTVGALAIGGAMVAGALAWELIGEKIFGIGDGSSHHFREVITNQHTIIHNQGTEIADLHKVVHNQAVEIASDHTINKHLTDVNNHLTQVDHHITKELGHEHRHELRKITHYGNSLEDLERREQSGSTGLGDHIRGTGAYWGIRYPWDWAVNKVGTVKAEGWLHALASKAAQHGHKIRWIINGQGKEILQVDGSTNTQKVLATITQYR